MIASQLQLCVLIILNQKFPSKKKKQFAPLAMFLSTIAISINKNCKRKVFKWKNKLDISEFSIYCDSSHRKSWNYYVETGTVFFFQSPSSSSFSYSSSSSSRPPHLHHLLFFNNIASSSLPFIAPFHCKFYSLKPTECWSTVHSLNHNFLSNTQYAGRPIPLR